MPKLSFPEAVRYFFASFALFCCWTAYDFKSATTTVNALGVLGTLAFLVAGTTIYFVYRSLIYDLFIMPLYDKVQKQNQRKYLKSDLPYPPLATPTESYINYPKPRNIPNTPKHDCAPYAQHPPISYTKPAFRHSYLHFSHCTMAITERH